MVVTAQKKTMPMPITASWLKTGSCPQCLPPALWPPCLDIQSLVWGCALCYELDLSISHFSLFHEVEGCLSQISVYPACLLAGLHQASLLLLMIFQFPLKLVNVMGGYLLIQTCSGRCIPVLTKPSVLSWASFHFWTPEEGSIFQFEELPLALCSGSLGSKERWSLHHFLVQHTRAPRLFWILKPDFKSLAKQVLPICFLKSHFPKLMMPWSLLQRFSDVTEIFAELGTAFSQNKGKTGTLVWPQCFSAFSKNFLREKELGLPEWKCVPWVQLSILSILYCQSPRDALSCCQVLCLQTFHCSRFKLDLQTTAF